MADVQAGELRLDEQVVAIDGQIWRLSSITDHSFLPVRKSREDNHSVAQGFYISLMRWP